MKARRHFGALSSVTLMPYETPIDERVTAESAMRLLKFG